MNLQCCMDRNADALARIAKRRGLGGVEEAAMSLLLEGIAAELGDEPRPGRPPIVPSTAGHPLDAKRFAEGRQHARDLDDQTILRLLGRR